MLRGFHKLCDKGLWDDARALLRDQGESAVAARESAAQPGGYGDWTALHIACKRDPPADVIKTLCTISSVPAESFDLYNKLPIHYAAEYGASVDVMKALIEVCPKCLSGVDNEGRTPLHLSFKFSIQDPATLVDPVRSFPSAEEVRLLLGNDTSVLWTADENEFIPLHYAVSNIDSCDKAVLEHLVEMDVNTVVAQTKTGMTPLQLALLKSTERKVTVEIVKLLLGISRDGKEWIEEEFDVTRMLSSSDKLPLHFACQNYENVPSNVIELLLERCPTAAGAKALEGGFPLQLLEAQRDTVRDLKELVIFNQQSDMLFSYYPNILPYRTESERLQRLEEKIVAEMSRKNARLSDELKSIWEWMCTFPEEEDKDHLYPKLVSSILESLPDAGSAKQLACIQTETDSGEMVPLYQGASPVVARVIAPYLRFVDRYAFKPGEVTNTDSAMTLIALDCHQTEDGKTRTVNITFYSKKDEYSREIDIHQKLKRMADTYDLNSPVIPIVQTFNMDRRGSSQETEDDVKFARDVTQFNDIYVSLSGYPYAIVRSEPSVKPIATSSYDETDKKYHIQNKQHLKDIAESIQCLHKSNYALGEMETTDFVQLQDESIKMKSVQSLIELDTHSPFADQFCGAVSEKLGISNLPPEMFCRLDSAKVGKYLAYWHRESNDSNIASELDPQEVKESEKLQKYLDEEGITFEDFWNRVQTNAALWKRIQPRQVGDHHYVVKCFRAHPNGTIHLAEELPYEPVRIGQSNDVWFFGSLLFELITGETLVHSNKSRNMINDNDFERLYHWKMSDASVSKRLNDIDDALARDLLRTILTTVDSPRQPNMETILQHPFFCHGSESALEQIYEEIAAEEKEVAKEYKIQQEKKLRKAVLEKRTDKLSLMTLQTQLRFEQTQWKFLSSKFDLSEVSYPTSCFVLPYELKKDFTGAVRIPDGSVAVGEKLSLITANILYYLKLVTFIQDSWDGESYGYKVQEYVDMNRNAASAPEDNLVRICEGVITKANNASAVMAEVIGGYVPKEDASSVAQKVVADTLKVIVDLEVCSRVVDGATKAQEAILSLLNTVGDYPEKAAENMTNEQIREIAGVDFTETSFAKKESIQTVLISIVQRFSENPLSVFEEMLESSICDMIDLYTEMQECHVYLVDEYSGLPVISNKFPRQMEFNPDVIKTFLAPSLLTMKSRSPLSQASLLGLQAQEMTQGWVKIVQSQISVQSAASNEINVLQSVLGVDDFLGRLETFFREVDSERNFAGLRRLSSPNGLIMWLTKASKQDAFQQAKQSLKELEMQEANEIKENITNMTSQTRRPEVRNLWRAETAPTNPALGKSVPAGSPRRTTNRKSATKSVQKEKNTAQMRSNIQNKLDRLRSWGSQGDAANSAPSVEEAPKRTVRRVATAYQNTKARVESEQTRMAKQQHDADDHISRANSRRVPAQETDDYDDYTDIDEAESAEEEQHLDEIPSRMERPVTAQPRVDTRDDVEKEHEEEHEWDNQEIPNVVYSVQEDDDTAAVEEVEMKIGESKSEEIVLTLDEDDYETSNLRTVKSDLSDTFNRGRWSPVHSEVEENEKTRSNQDRPTSSSSDIKVNKLPPSTAAVPPRIFRRSTTQNNSSTQRTPIEPRVSSGSSIMGDEGSRKAAPSPQRPMPGEKRQGNPAFKTLSKNSPRVQRIHNGRKAFQQNAEEDNNSIFLSARSPFERKHFDVSAE